MEPFFVSFFFFKFCIFHPTAVCREYYADAVNFPPVFTSWGRRVFLQLQGGQCEEKVWAVRESVFCQFWKENMSRAWFLNLFGFILKLFLKKKKPSYFIWFASFREEIRICAQRWRLSVSMACAGQCAIFLLEMNRSTRAHSSCQSWPFFVTCQHVTGVDWKLLKRGRVAWLSFSM